MITCFFTFQKDHKFSNSHFENWTLEGKAALHIALAWEDLRLFEILLSRGANQNVRNKANQSIMDLILLSNKLKVIPKVLTINIGFLFTRLQDGQTFLGCLIERFNIEFIIDIISANTIKIEQTIDHNARAYNALHWAVMRKDLSVFKILLENSPDALEFFVRSPVNQLSPLQLASYLDQSEILLYFFDSQESCKFSDAYFKNWTLEGKFGAKHSPCLARFDSI